MNMRDRIVQLKGKPLFVELFEGRVHITDSSLSARSNPDEITEVGDDFFTVRSLGRSGHWPTITYSIAAVIRIVQDK